MQGFTYLKIITIFLLTIICSIIHQFFCIQKFLADFMLHTISGIYNEHFNTISYLSEQQQNPGPHTIQISRISRSVRMCECVCAF